MSKSQSNTAAPAQATTASPYRAASWLDANRDAAQMHESDGSSTWLLRGDAFVVAITLGKPGTQLRRAASAREHMLVLPPGVTATATCGAQCEFALPENSLTILPPGDTTVTLAAQGHIVRIFSTLETDLVAQAANTSLYADLQARDPLPWHAPLDGFRIRSYPLERYAQKTGPLIRPRLFRTADLMLNVFEPFAEPRPVAEVRPHSHADYDQASIALTGDWFHHLRTPWSANMAHWRDDQHVKLPSPSVAVIPAKLIHTSRNTTPGALLLDVFGTPRVDFLKAGIVLNAGEYAMPSEEAEITSLHVPDAWRRASSPSASAVDAATQPASTK
jgi:hypothetical protein